MFMKNMMTAAATDYVKNVVLITGFAGCNKRRIPCRDGDTAQPEVHEHSSGETTAGGDSHRTGRAGPTSGGKYNNSNNGYLECLTCTDLKHAHTLACTHIHTHTESCIGAMGLGKRKVFKEDFFFFNDRGRMTDKNKEYALKVGNSFLQR